MKCLQSGKQEEEMLLIDWYVLLSMGKFWFGWNENLKSHQAFTEKVFDIPDLSEASVVISSFSQLDAKIC